MGAEDLKKVPPGAVASPCFSSGTGVASIRVPKQVIVAHADEILRVILLGYHSRPSRAKSQLTSKSISEFWIIPHLVCEFLNTTNTNF